MPDIVNIEKVYPWIKVIEAPIDGGAVTVFDGAGNRATLELPWRPWLGDLGVFFVADAGDRFEVVQSQMLPDGLDMAALYNKACANLIRDVEFNFCPTAWGGAGIVCGGDFEACGICLPGLAEFLGQQFGGDFVMGVPARTFSRPRLSAAKPRSTA